MVQLLVRIDLIQLVKVGERLLIVGVGENIQLLTEIEKGQEFDQIIMNYNQKLDEMLNQAISSRR